MFLSCSCDYDPEPGDIYWEMPDDFSQMPKLARRKRCWSCHKLLDSGSEVLCINRFKVMENHDKPLSPKYLCDRCGELYATLYDMGYECVPPSKTLQALEEYWEETGFDPDKYKTASAPVEGLATCP